MFSGLQGGSGTQTKPPREENFWDMWKFTFCGNFKPTAVPAVIYFVMTGVYIASLVGSELFYDGLNNYVFLGPSLQLLQDWGAKDPYAMKYKYQYWRLVTAAFLSDGFLQYVFNSLTLLLIGFICDGTGAGFNKMAMIFFGSAIGGTLFGSVCSSFLAVGVDIGYFGFIPAMMAAAIVNWHALEPIGMMRLCLIMMLVFLFMIVLLFTAPSLDKNLCGPFTNCPFSYYDFYGHFGSFIAGLFLGLMLMPRVRRLGQVQESSLEKLCFKIGAGGLALFTILMTTLWFTVVVPTQYTF